jgi:DNA repair exonuclease SbcCD ATPase subunit
MDVRRHDRLLHEIELRERADEDLYFTVRDRELLRKLHEAGEEQHRELVRDLAHERCPECGARLQRERHRGVSVRTCPHGHGLWLTEPEMRTLAKREHDSWIGRFFYRLKPLV